MVYTLYMYVQKCFQVVYYQPLLLDMFWGLQSKVAGTGKKLVYTPKSQSPPSQSHPFTCQTRDFLFSFSLHLQYHPE